MKKNLQYIWKEWLRPFVFLIVVVAPLRSAVVDWNWVPTGSMKPTIMEGDLVLVNKLAYDLKVPFTTRHLASWGEPARGEVVVFFSPKNQERLVKRVIGLPGDQIELRNEILYVNGFPQSYRMSDVGPFMNDIFEDKNPILAFEHLGSHDHYVMAFPGRSAMRSFGPYVVPAGKYFMMGDSRDNSLDSRYFGPVPRDQIVGRATAVIVSFAPSRFLMPRIKRFVSPLKLDGA